LNTNSSIGKLLAKRFASKNRIPREVVKAELEFVTISTVSRGGGKCLVGLLPLPLRYVASLFLLLRGTLWDDNPLPSNRADR
jgi:hypothetical protein